MRRYAGLLAAVAGVLVGVLFLSVGYRDTAYAQSSISSQFSQSATVTSAYTDVLTLVLGGRGEKISIGLSNTGASLTDFRLQIQAHPSADWESWLGGADWTDTSISNIKFCTSTVPNTLASGGHALVEVELPGSYAVKLQALCGTSTTLTARGTLTSE